MTSGYDHMKRIILYGVTSVELRRNIEFFLDKDCEIIGYSDTHYREDVLDGEPFFAPEELCQFEFDCVIPLSFQRDVLEMMRRHLLARGIPKDKIVYPVVFLQRNAEKCQLDLIADIQECDHREEGLIFGLSYSLRGICTDKLAGRYYDCSWSSLDLYYNIRLFQYMAEHGLLTTVRSAFLCFPYYYFDYDMSRFLHLYENGHIFAVRQLDDWHHYREVPGASDYVENYRMFGQRLSEFYRFRRFTFQSQGVYSGQDGMERLNTIWFRRYEDTFSENKTLFIQFIRDLLQRQILPVLIVPPFYLNGINETSRAAFSEKKARFYDALRDVQSVLGHSLRIFDYSGIFANKREYFMDITHLNSHGGEMFTEILNEQILQGGTHGLSLDMEGGPS